MRLPIVSIALMLMSPVLAEEPKPPTTPEQQFAQIRAIADSVVTVEYTLRYDNGEPPRLGYRELAGAQSGEAGAQIVAEERPLEVFSYLIGDDLVISEEAPVHERFIEKIEVRFGDDLVPAAPVAWATTRHASYLKLQRPLKGAKPLSFDAELPGPYTGLVAGADNGVPAIMVTPFTPIAVVSPELGNYLSMPREAVVVDKAGAPVGMSMSPFLPAPGGDKDWKGDPREWEQLTVEQRGELLEKIRAAADVGIVRVTLNFRSPKGQPNPFAARMRIGRGGGAEEDEITEQHLVGIVIRDGLVIIPALLKPELTARLDRIRIYPLQGEPINASFVATLKDYGAFIAKVDAPAAASGGEGGLRLSDKPISAYHNRLLPHAHIEVRGEERLIYLGHRRIENFDRGWRTRIYPVVPDDRGDTYLFDETGTLIAFPVARREKFTGDEERWRTDQPLLTPTSYIAEVLADLDAHSDLSNIPLSEDQESRLAWLGVVLQPLNRDLARANKVAEQTNDGQTGAVVNFVYPGSPAAQAGVEPGWILVRLRVPGHPQPIDATVSEGAAGFPLPWDQLDQLPEQYYERIPPPWPSAENELTRMLTEAGFGTVISAEFFADGNRIVKEFTVEQSPPHYDSAARHTSHAMGLTVRDVTYELRQYFQMADDEPGLIISKIEPGSKASIAGIKPYEMVTHVNGQPVKSVEQFAESTAPGGELRLTIKRMTRTRQVPVKIEPASPELPDAPEAADPADAPDAPAEACGSNRP